MPRTAQPPLEKPLKSKKRFFLLIPLYCAFFCGCHVKHDVDDVLPADLLLEVVKIKAEISHDVEESYVKKCISSVESSLFLVDVSVDGADTLVAICIFDPTSPLNTGHAPQFVYEDCSVFENASNTIYLSKNYMDTFGRGIPRKLLSKEKGAKVGFVDGLFKYFHYRAGALTEFSLPPSSYEVTVILDSM